MFGHSITSTTEYVDRSAQTDLMYSRRRSFKTSPASTIDEDEVLSPTDVEPETRSVASDAAATEARAAAAAAATAGSERDARKEDDLRMRELESFEGAKARPIVRLGRSVSACERVHHRVPRIHRIMNQESAESNDSEEDLLAKPFDSLPLLSAPATMDNKNRLFRFSPDNERVLGGMKPRSRLLEKPDFSYGTQLSSRSVECVSDTAALIRFSDDSRSHISEEGEGTPEQSSRSPTPPAEEPKEAGTPRAHSLEQTPSPSKEEAKEGPARRKPPMKFLKRAQSLSYVFKRTKPEKRKKVIRDDYAALPTTVEPQGEMALVPLEKLVAIEDIQMQPSLSSYSCYAD